MKLDALGNFVPLYFSLNFNFLLPLFPGAIFIFPELEELFLSNFWNNYTNLYKHLWLFGSKKGNINFWKFITIWA